jgi:hypothetical protein
VVDGPRPVVGACRALWTVRSTQASSVTVKIATHRETRLRNVIERPEVVAAHRELCEASDAVRHLLVVETLTQTKIDEARDRLARAYERAQAIDAEALHV